MIDAASGGALVDKTPMESQTLIANIEPILNNLEIGMRHPLGELMKLESIRISNNNWPPSLV